ncbi:MAG TPA: zinc-binding dehydrogenase, partial [Reyranella sp.]|nr:zinc-binding dehydrogenase [Reyranella sp.]
MKQVLIDRYGTPWDVARTADVPDVGDPAPDEVVFNVLAFPINPADLWFCRGSYRLKPPLPATPGAECVGRVVAVGAAVKHVKKGDLVINLQRENWAQRRKVKGDDAIPLPAGIDLKPGDWVIQNVANSAVGRLLIVLAGQRGLRTVNVVRRPALADELKTLGADIVIVDGDDLAQRVAKQTAEARIMLGVEAIGGAATGRLADCIATDGTLVHYGSMSGEDPQVGRSNFIYRGVRLTGFMLG